MNDLMIASIGAAVYGVIREIGGQIVAIKKVSGEQDANQRKSDSEKEAAYRAEVKKEYELARAEAKAALAKAEEAIRKQHDCEKDKIRMEAKLDLLTTLYGKDIPSDSKVHRILNAEGLDNTDG